LAATYARWKGQDLFIKAAASVAARLPKNSVRFYIIGGPIYATPGSQFQPDELRKLGTELGLGPELAFVGFQQSMAEVYRALNIVVHASTRPEPFGRTIVEAMACGRAVIVSNAGGAMELFTEGHDALGIPPCDVNALAEAMIRLIQDRGLRDVLGRNARQTACARFDRRRLGSEMIKIYDHEHALR